MNNEIRAAMQLFENKLASLWQLDGQLREVEDDERAYRLETRQRSLQNEVDRARADLIVEIDKLETALKEIEQFGHSHGHGRGYTCANIALAALQKTD